MTLRSRRVCLAILAALSLALAAASTAWACFGPDQGSIALDPPRGSTDDIIRVVGRNWGFGPGYQPVELRWNSLAGPKIGEAQVDSNARFFTTIQIPEDSPGVHYVIATQSTPGSSTKGAGGVTARASFEMVAENVPAPQGEDGTDPGTSRQLSGRAGGGGEVPAGDGTTTGRASGGSAQAPGDGNTSGVQSGSEAEPGTLVARGGRTDTSGLPRPGAKTQSSSPTGRSQVDSRGAGEELTARSGDTSASSIGGAERDPDVIRSSGAPVFAGSLSSGRDRDARPSGGAELGATGPGEGTSSADLFGGFRTQGGSLLQNASTASGAGDEGAYLAMTAGLFGAGLIALFAGFAVAEMRRRKAQAFRGDSRV